MSPPTTLRTVLAAAALAALAGCDAKTVKLADGVWAVSAGALANYGIVSGEFGTVVIDSGPGPIPGSDLAKLAESLTACEVTYLVNTSDSPLRVLGNQSFKHAEIVAHSGVYDEMTSRGEELLRRLREHPRGKELGAGECRIVPPTVTFETRMALRMPDRQVVVINPGGGPSAGSSLVLLPKERILFAGDYVLVRTAPELREGCDLAAWMASLDAVEKLAEGCRVVPGAGEVSGGECVRWMRDWLRELAESVTALAAAGGTVEQALDQVKLTRYNGWARHGELRESNVRIAFDWAKRQAALRQARDAAEAVEEKR